MVTHQQAPHLTPGGRAVLDAAAELFYERGISAVGVDTIAEEAGVTKKTVYDRFKSKSALICAYLAERDDKYRRWVTTWWSQHPETPPALAIFDALEGWLNTQSHQGCAFVHAHAELLADPGHPAITIIHQQKQWLFDTFEKLLEDDDYPSPRSLADQLLALHEGAAVLYSVADFPHAVAHSRLAAEKLLNCRDASEAP